MGLMKLSVESGGLPSTPRGGGAAHRQGTLSFKQANLKKILGRPSPAPSKALLKPKPAPKPTPRFTKSQIRHLPKPRAKTPNRKPKTKVTKVEIKFRTRSKICNELQLDNFN